MFASTFKISIPGAGLSAFAASAANIADIARKMSFQTIGPDKLNQLRHTRFFKGLAGIESQMEKHAALIGAKFDAVSAALTKHSGGGDRSGALTQAHGRLFLQCRSSR